MAEIAVDSSSPRWALSRVLRVPRSIWSGTAGRLSSRPWSVTRVLTLLVALAALGYFGFTAYTYTNETQREVRELPWRFYDWRVDFAYFYSGASMAWHGEAWDLYPVEGEQIIYPPHPIFGTTTDEYQMARWMARGNYYNPPALAYIQAPLTSLGFRSAWLIFTGMALTALAGYGLLAWRAGKSVPELPLLLVGVAAFKPVHEAIIMGHTTLFFVLILTAGFLLLRGKHSVLAGLTFSLLALKPQWAVLPGLFLLARREYRAFFVMGIASSLIFFVPFFITGFETFSRYFEFLRTAAKIDIKDAPHMFSWNGFLYKLEGYDPSDPGGDPRIIYGMIGLTAMFMFIVWWSKDYFLSAAATVIAMLLVSTHSVWYDWGLLVVAALMLLLRPMKAGQRVELWIVLMALTVASSQSIAELLQPDRQAIDWPGSAFYSITPIAFASLVWIASIAARDGLLKLPRFGRTAPALPMAATVVPVPPSRTPSRSRRQRRKSITARPQH